MTFTIAVATITNLSTLLTESLKPENLGLG
jgi:hypothetical protein